MKCPNCQADVQNNQNFCGGCGNTLQHVCAGCGTASPLSFQFCGQCGKNLTAFGMVVLDGAGIVLEADKVSLEILSRPATQVKGRPFSFFVAIDDMVIYFSHWNELMDTSERQSMEIEIKTDSKKPIFVQVELSNPDPGDDGRYHMSLSDVTDRRTAQNDLQNKHDLINIVFSITEDLENVRDADRKLAICDILEKICLFIGAEHSFLYRFSRPNRHLETFCQWHHPDSNNKTIIQPEIPMASIKNILAKLQNGGTYIADNIKSRAANERKELKFWQDAESGAALFQTIYFQKRPFGVIGVLKDETDSWSQDTISLIKLVSKLFADALQGSTAAFTKIQTTKRKAPQARFDTEISISENEIDTMNSSDIISMLGKPRMMNAAEAKGKPDKADTKPDDVKKLRMSFKPDAGGKTEDPQKVFIGENGKFRVTCPACRHQEYISPDLFAEKGSALQATCRCSHSFPIMREQRTSFRKKVKLEGFYNQVVSGVSKTASGPAWAPIMVRDLSKAGLSFTSPNASLLRPGDPLLLQFNLDNGPGTLIKKKALIKSVKKDKVGCQFEGSDRYDVSLGFYFI